MVEPEEIADARRALGRQLALLRQAASYTQWDLAKRTHYSRSTVANVEIGRQNVPRGFWLTCDELLTAGGALVGAFDEIETARQQWQRAAAYHQTVRPRPMNAAHSGESEPELDSLFDIVQRVQWASAASVNDVTLGQLEQLAAQAIRNYERVGPLPMAHTLVAQRRWLHGVMLEHQPPRYAARLHLLAAQLSGILATVSLDLARFTIARAYAAEAFSLAELVSQPDIQAWVRGTQSLVEYYAGAYRESLAYAVDGQRLAPHGPQCIRLMVNGEARASARLGDARGVDRAVNRANELLRDVPAGQGISHSLSLGPYCAARVAGNAATAYLLLNQPKRVLGYGEQALAVFDRARLQGPRALTRLDMATALVRGARPEPDRAAGLVRDALAVDGAHEFASVTQRASEFLAVAGRLDQPSVRQVSEQVRALVSTRDMQTDFDGTGAVE